MKTVRICALSFMMVALVLVCAGEVPAADTAASPDIVLAQAAGGAGGVGGGIGGMGGGGTASGMGNAGGGGTGSRDTGSGKMGSGTGSSGMGSGSSSDPGAGIGSGSTGSDTGLQRGNTGANSPGTGNPGSLGRARANPADQQVAVSRAVAADRRNGRPLITEAPVLTTGASPRSQTSDSISH